MSPGVDKLWSLSLEAGAMPQGLVTSTEIKGVLLVDDEDGISSSLQQFVLVEVLTSVLVPYFQ
jgi:hypothetical protein